MRIGTIITKRPCHSLQISLFRERRAANIPLSSINVKVFLLRKPCYNEEKRQTSPSVVKIEENYELTRRRSPIPTYAIGMESPTERYLYCVGIHEEDARALFSRITEGELSPVHLGDVVADLLWEQGQRAKEAGEISQKTLQTDQSMI